ncbi:FMN-binding negative transcriptional regulator [Bacillus sp. BHET2]|uniref:FMN-binding negative transcriptional regulator n=1 Tax=Bacillus sp. BHET2 TaxID=2583818 RepID=UPI00110F3ED3|nr:FMN-binding negative transcriptional regulator [Bacillus sp. BHET2]TMU84530.1 FMN-binding negative transcriptional regulator [Bacillus sp. BHET2]
MYIPKEFAIQDEDILFTIIDENSFATVFSHHNGKPFATHLPLYLDRETHFIYGHFAKANPQWGDCAGQEILVVFQGPHAYISPSWYETNQTVPTWNYVAVHVYGQIELIESDAENVQALASLVDKYEHPHSSYSLTEVDENVSEGLRKGIVGFKILITSIEGKAKLSQNHPLDRQQLVINLLEQSQSENGKAIASLMKLNISTDS